MRDEEKRGQAMRGQAMAKQENPPFILNIGTLGAL